MSLDIEEEEGVEGVMYRCSPVIFDMIFRRMVLAEDEEEEEEGEGEERVRVAEDKSRKSVPDLMR